MTVNHSELPVDTRVSRVIEILRAYTQESWNELIMGTGIPKHTMTRRRAHGGWTAAEVEAIADHFNKPVAMFYAGPEGLFPDQSPGVIRRYTADHMTVTAA